MKNIYKFFPEYENKKLIEISRDKLIKFIETIDFVIVENLLKKNEILFLAIDMKILFEEYLTEINNNSYDFIRFYPENNSVEYGILEDKIFSL